MHQIRSIYLANKIRPDMTLTFKVALLKLKITSGVANLLYCTSILNLHSLNNGL